MDTTQIFWGIIFGLVGFVFFSYGKKQQKAVPMLVGVGFFIIPYFVSNVYLLIAIGIILMIIPYFIRS